MAAIHKQSSVVPYKKVAVIGFGLTGQSVINYLGNSTTELIAMDTRELVTNTQALRRSFPKVRLVTGGLDQYTLETADMVVVSPGVSIRELDLRNKIGPQTQLLGDIELFARYATAPIIAITGSNGKSTVASLVKILVDAGDQKVLLGGNIGVPALDLFEKVTPDVYVIELSSFQLETTSSLKADVAVVLNLSEDHLDRYDSYQAYVDTKMQVYHGARREVINRDEPLVPQITLPDSLSFGLSTPKDESEFGVIREDEKCWLARGNEKLLETANLALNGQQNWLNVLASFALVTQYGMSLNDEMIAATCQFDGLLDRCEQIADHGGVIWINDSKGTNVGATLAAIEGFAQPKIMIMGGQSKGADLSPLREAIGADVREVILIGEDAGKIADVLDAEVNTSHPESLEQAVLRAQKIAKPGDVVLMSPACASFDMFDSYAARGEAFRQLVKQCVLNEVAS